MQLKTILRATAAVAAMLVAAPAFALNEGPPSGTEILNLDGTAIFSGYTEYSASFLASDPTTNISFAFREDPAFLFLDDATVTTGGGPNLLLNGDFELGPVGSSAPTDFTYLNIFGATFGGVVSTNSPNSGSLDYYDGAVGAYDAITQAIATTPGDTYTVDFFLMDNSGGSTYSALSTNGQSGTDGNGINLVVYAGGIPTPTVPEPATWALMLLGFGGVGCAMRRSKTTSRAA